MYKKFINALELLNILFQALYSLVLPIGIGVLFSFLTTRYLGAPKWIWAVLLTVGTLIGLYCMVKYLLSALSGLERLEKQREEAMAEKRLKEEKIKNLKSEFVKEKSEEENT